MMEIEEAITQVYDQSVEHLSEFLLALALIAAGVCLGWLLKFVAETILRSLGLDGFAERSGLARALKQASRLDKTLTQLVGQLVFWAIFLLFLASALNTVGLAVIADSITSTALFLPRVIGAVLITFGSLFAGRLLRDLIVEDKDRREAPEIWERMGDGTRAAVVSAGVLLGLMLLGMDLNPLLWLLIIILLIGGAIAVLFGHRRRRSA